MKNITDKFLDSLLERTDRELSESDLQKLKSLLLDYLGVAHAGASMLKENHLSYLEKISDSDSHASLFGIKKKCSFQNAALLNGMSAHAPEMDDGVRFGNFHPGASIISALLAVAEKENLRAESFFRGMMAGYEASVSLATALQPSHKKRGFHTTATCGVIGSAIGVASMMEFSRNDLKAALTLAATSSSGLLEATRDQSVLKPYHAGKAASNGIGAAYFAASGYYGGEDILGGEEGFFKALSDEELPLDLFNDQIKAIDMVYMKPYAACRHAHPAIEAALILREEGVKDSHTIRAIDIETYDIGIKGHDHTEVHDVSSAKMSTPFSVAAAIVLGNADINAFSESSLQDVEIHRLAKIVNVHSDIKMSQKVPHKRPARVTIKFKNDTTVTREVELPKGEPERPLSNEELIEKFISLVNFAGKNEKWADQMINNVLNLKGSMAAFFNLAFDNKN